MFRLLHIPPGGCPRGCVLYAHPFAEEMNKSRRMAAVTARRLADQGFVVLMPDLHGCGDSAGDFSEARWETWLEELKLCVDLLRERFDAPLVLWGLRVGCLLLGELARRCDPAPAAMVYWQPVVSGELFLTQFLRLRMAASMIGGEKETTGQLRARLKAGEVLEVAGYGLSPELAGSLGETRLLTPAYGGVHWLELGTGELPPASARVVTAWREQGLLVDSVVLAGEPFWATQEIREAPALVSDTVRRFDVLI